MYAKLLLGLLSATCVCFAATSNAVANESTGSCWADAKTKVNVALFPGESSSDPADPTHRVRPEMRGEDGTVYPAADFVLTRRGTWIDAVTGISAEVFPEASNSDPENPDHRFLYKDSKMGHDVVAAEYSRVDCTPGKVTATSETAMAPEDAQRLSEEILAEINAARTDPVGYAARLKNSADPEIKETVEFLQRQSPLAPLKLQVALLTSAARHATDQGRAGARGHVGTDGSSIRERIEAAAGEVGQVGEDIAFDADTGVGVARQLIVDHGVPDRGHRISLFNASWTNVGVACTPHTTYRLICVIDVTGPASR